MEAELSSYSCVRCKHSHRKCSRTLPECTECASKNIICSYEEIPKKPGPKRGDKKRKHEPYPSPQPFSPCKFEIAPAVENFFECLCMTSPAYNNAEDLLEYRRATMNGEKFNGKMPSNEEVAMFYAEQAVFYRKMNIADVDRICATASKKILGESFDMILGNFQTAYTYMLLGVYYMQDVDAERSLFYLNNARSYIERWRMIEPSQSLEYQLEKARVNCLEVHLRCFALKSACDSLMYLKVAIYLNCATRKYRQLYHELHGSKTIDDSYAEVDELLPILDLIKKDIELHSNEHFPIDLHVIDLIAAKFSMPVTSTTNLDLFVSLKRKNMLLLALAAKMQLLQSSGQRTSTQVRRVADEIHLLVDSAPYGLTYTGYVLPVVKALKTHSDCLTDPSDLFSRQQTMELLQREIDVMKDFIKASRRIESLTSLYVTQAEQKMKQEFNPVLTLDDDIDDMVEKAIQEYTNSFI